ncbi:MAG: TIGR04076 family protein [Thermoplasmata archaeon]|nr:MAG: TIGR04076 family protein [Thermoplasmata archaeon]
MAKLTIKVVEIKGKCEVHSIGDIITIDGPEMDLKRTDRICIHALAPILHYAVAIRDGVDPVRLGLAKEGGKAFIHCPDPGEPYTDGGEVIFELEMLKD